MPWKRHSSLPSESQFHGCLIIAGAFFTGPLMLPIIIFFCVNLLFGIIHEISKLSIKDFNSIELFFASLALFIIGASLYKWLKNMKEDCEISISEQEFFGETVRKRHPISMHLTLETFLTFSAIFSIVITTIYGSFFHNFQKDGGDGAEFLLYEFFLDTLLGFLISGWILRKSTKFYPQFVGFDTFAIYLFSLLLIIFNILPWLSEDYHRLSGL